MLPLDAQLEAILFYRAEPVKIGKLAELLNCPEAEIMASLSSLKEKLSGRGVTLVENDKTVQLGTNPTVSDLIERIAKEELSSELGKASLETLSLVLYRGPLSRSAIDYVRGVNSSYILRHLLIRGLIERMNKEGEGRGYIYKPSLELLQYLGLTRVEDLPDYDSVQVKVESFIKDQANDSATNVV